MLSEIRPLRVVGTGQHGASWITFAVDGRGADRHQLRRPRRRRTGRADRRLLAGALRAPTRSRAPRRGLLSRAVHAEPLTPGRLHRAVALGGVDRLEDGQWVEVQPRAEMG